MSRLFHSLLVCGAGLTLLDCDGRSVQRSLIERALERAFDEVMMPGLARNGVGVAAQP